MSLNDATKNRAPAHQNQHKFRHNKNSKKTRVILAAPIEGVCEKCQHVLEWRKEFRKYKPLTVPKKCVMCQEKKVTRSYTIVCADCAKKHRICAKCQQVKEIIHDFGSHKREEEEQRGNEKILGQLRERDRRRYLNSLEKGKFDSDEEDDDEEESGSDKLEKKNKGDGGEEKVTAPPAKESLEEKQVAGKDHLQSSSISAPTSDKALVEFTPLRQGEETRESEDIDEAESDDEGDVEDLEGDLKDEDAEYLLARQSALAALAGLNLDGAHANPSVPSRHDAVDGGLDSDDMSISDDDDAIDGDPESTVLSDVLKTPSKGILFQPATDVASFVAKYAEKRLEYKTQSLSSKNVTAPQLVPASLLIAPEDEEHNEDRVLDLVRSDSPPVKSFVFAKLTTDKK